MYSLAIVDCLTKFTWGKAAERNLKAIKHGIHKVSQLSSQPPSEYSSRMKEFLEKLIQ